MHQFIVAKLAGHHAIPKLPVLGIHQPAPVATVSTVAAGSASQCRVSSRTGVCRVTYVLSWLPPSAKRKQSFFSLMQPLKPKQLFWGSWFLFTTLVVENDCHCLLWLGFWSFATQMIERISLWARRNGSMAKPWIAGGQYIHCKAQTILM